MATASAGNSACVRGGALADVGVLRPRDVDAMTDPVAHVVVTVASGSKHHLIIDSAGIPLAVIVTGGNRDDVTQLVPLPEAILPVRGKRG